MSFETDGFFSPEIAVFRRAVRETQPFKEWFDYALGLNRLGFDMLRRMQTKRSDRRQFTLNAHFVRVHRSFQSALILAERGQVPDARVVLRSAVEGAIAINALAKDEGFVDQMVEAHHRSQRTLARVQIAKFGASWPSEDIAIMNAAIGVADAYEASKGKELTDIKWEQVAEKHCPNLYQFLYRNLSSDGTHATVNSLERFLVADERGEVTHFNAAPDMDGLVEALSHASLVFLWSAKPYAETNGFSDAHALLNSRLREFATLPGAFS